MASFPCQANERLGKPKCDDTRLYWCLVQEVILPFFYLKAICFQFLLILPDVGEYHAQKIFPILLVIWSKSFCCKYWLIYICWKVVGRVVMVITFLYICLKPSCCLWFWVLYYNYHYPSGGLPHFFVLLNNLTQ